MDAQLGSFRRTLAIILVVLAGALLLAACGPKAEPASLEIPVGAEAGDLTSLKKCPYQAQGSKTVYEAECGTLVVPENRDQAGSRLIALPVVRIPAFGTEAAEPVFLLRGGPGAPNLSWEPADWLLKNHDLIMVGYRGAEGTVQLDCPNVDPVYRAHVGKDVFSAETLTEYVDAVKQCAAAFEEAGVDLSGYTMAGVIEDMEAARRALGYDRINLLSESYGTRLAQIYAYMHPESLNRAVLLGFNAPGHFIWHPEDLDRLIGRMSELCAQDADCSSRTRDLAQAMYDVNHNMAKSWLFFPIDEGTVRFGTHSLFFRNPQMAMVTDAYLAAAQGDPSGLAMMNLIAKLMPAPRLMGDQFSKAMSADVELYGGRDSVSLGDSIMGAPFAEMVWPLASEWPMDLMPEELREIQESDVEMLLINGTLDFSTPPFGLEEVRPYYHKAQIVLLPDFGHTADLCGLQQEALERLVTSYYDTGVGDDSMYVYEPLSFKPGTSLVLMAKSLLAAMVLLPALAVFGIVSGLRRLRRRRTTAAEGPRDGSARRSDNEHAPLGERINEKEQLMNSRTAVRNVLIISALLSSTLAMLRFPAGASADAESRAAVAGSVPVTSSQSEGPTDPAELEAFLDDLMARDMEELHIAGAAISVVRDGKLIFAKGYGYADVENGIPVDAEQTMFGIGSIGKLFTWTAVMQQVEQGKLDLDADVNTYLDFRIPDTFPQPITLKHLMTHTAGFEDKLLGGLVNRPEDLVPPRDWILSHMPARLYPPGHIPSYTNFNAVLAGYIVSRVSGEAYDQYVQNHIFNPLGMMHSTVQSPLPPAMSENMSLGYTYEDGVFQPFLDFIAQPAGLPSGWHHASVTDMARFLIAHLQGGRYSDSEIPEARILNETTAQLMQTTLYQFDPRMLGTAYGFFELTDNGQRTLGSSGYLPPMHSLFLLLPEEDLGVFVTYNSKGSGELTLQHSGFQRAFFDHYYPTPEVAALQPPADFEQEAGRFAGIYRVSSSPSTTLIKIVELFGAYRVPVMASGDGTLLVNVEGMSFRFAEVEPLFFRQADGPFNMIFREDERGRITEMYTDVMPQYGMVKLQWYETTPFNVALAMSCLLIFLSMVVVAAIRSLRSRRGGRETASETRGAKVAWRIIVWICVLNLLYLVGTALWGNPPTELHDVRLISKFVLGLGVLAAVLTAAAAVYAVLAWKNGFWGLVTRSYYTLVTLAAGAFVWFLNYWNLLGWRY